MLRDDAGDTNGDSLGAPGRGRWTRSASNESAEHAMVFGLRNSRDEAQLTKVVAAIARSDASFARGFAEALLEQARVDCVACAGALKALGGLPRHISCASERSLYDVAGRRLGRADLVFEGEADGRFVLVVENKLFSGFGAQQLERYQAGLRAIRGHGGRGGLIALTRDVPTTGELTVGDDEWLGSIRWARLLPRLRALQIEEPGVQAQWRLLLEVLDEQGDLGMTQIDADAVRAWSRYLHGRAQVQWLLEQVVEETLDATRRSLAGRSPAPKADVASLWYKGRAGRVLIQQNQSELRFGISVPASYVEQSLQVACWFEDPGEIRFGVCVLPRSAGEALDRGDARLLRQLKILAGAGFEQLGSRPVWFSSHDGEPILQSGDAPSALLELVKADLMLIAQSKILSDDLNTPVPRAIRRKHTARPT